MEVLPDRPAYGARNSNVVVQPRQVAGHRELNQIVVHLHPAPRPHPGSIQELDLIHLVSDHQPAEPPVTDQDVGAKPKHEIRHLQLAGGEHCSGEFIRGAGAVQQVRWAADLEGCERRQRNVALEATGATEALSQSLYR